MSRVTPDDLATALVRAALGPYAIPRTLPRHTRLRLWFTRQRDNAAYWLVCRGRSGAAVAVWRLTGAWRKRR